MEATRREGKERGKRRDEMERNARKENMRRIDSTGLSKKMRWRGKIKILMQEKNLTNLPCQSTARKCQDIHR
eukprot:455435-Hanusia_phi.AAC.2